MPCILLVGLNIRDTTPTRLWSVCWAGSLALKEMGAGQGSGFSESEPSPRWGHFSVAVGDQLYVWGGRTKDFSNEKNALASSIYCFHPVLESWSDHQCNGLPPPVLYNGASASTGNYLYLYSGQ